MYTALIDARPPPRFWNSQNGKMTRGGLIPLDRRQWQAKIAVFVALVVAFVGAMLGVIFGIVLGPVSGPEAWIISLCTGVSGGLLLLLLFRHVSATGVITGILSVYLVFHLNAGTILNYRVSQDIVRIVPYIVWFFPLVLFHEFTNFGFFKKQIRILVSLSPIPVVVFILTHLPETSMLTAIDAMVTFSVCFAAFLVFVSFYAKHRDAEVLHAALTDEAERSADTLRANEERFSLIAKATGNAVWEWDRANNRLWWSDGLKEIFGHEPDVSATLPTIWQAHIHPEDERRVNEALLSIMSGSTAHVQIQYRFRRADGSWAIVEDRAFTVLDGAGNVARVLGSMTDISQRIQLEERLRQAQKMESVGQLTGGVAHDFNNLLTIILGNAEILAAELEHAPQLQRLAEITLNTADRGAELTRRLLAFSRLQALEPRVLDVGQLVQGLEGLLRRTMPASIDIEIVRAGGLWQAAIDPGQFESALLNLALNARDAMAGAGSLTIEVANAELDDDFVVQEREVEPGQYVLVVVTDTGHGMPPETRERVFEPFFTTKGVGKGSGLGLSMVYGFVKQSGGHIRVYSERSEGSSFKLYFPRSQQKTTQDQPHRASAGHAGGTEVILVVEDDELVRDHVVTQLNVLGYRVFDAPAGQYALDILNQKPGIDLLFTDVVMPGGMDGPALAAAAKAIRPDLKVLFTSGYPENAIVHNGKLPKGVHLLSKPYRRDQLASKLREVLDGDKA